MENEIHHDYSLLSKDDLFLFNEGTHRDLFQKLGAHPTTHKGVQGTYFAVWAPNAKDVSVLGDFNYWKSNQHNLKSREESGIWEGFITGLTHGMLYKFSIQSKYDNYSVQKADPFAFANEHAPKTASIIWDLDYNWYDQKWMASRKNWHAQNMPVSIYEVHLGSWKREKNGNFLNYRDLGEQLASYVVEMGFTHVELLPIMEHPFYGSWGYQTTGYFAATHRYGTPQDLMNLVDQLHQKGIGVIIDWVPSHFPADEHGLGFFDGTHLYEHQDPRQGFHPDWKSHIFNYGRNEIQSFLTSSAMFWAQMYHIDGIRVDAVASMLYLDYSRKEGEWIPNQHGGRENLHSVAFLKQLNCSLCERFPGIQMIAEESTAWPNVSRPTYEGGLGFHFKWDMGWMHDTLRYFQRDTIHRRYHQNDLTFRMMYAFTETFMLSLSHDEVVHMKGSLLERMPGDEWQRFANLRLLFGYMFGQPGKKLLFMGNEFGQPSEWSHESELQWSMLQYDFHKGVQTWVKSLNRLYREERALHSCDNSPEGFFWIDCHDEENSVLSYARKSPSSTKVIICLCNFTPVVQKNYRIGVPTKGTWQEILNSDHKQFGGSGVVNNMKISTQSIPYHHQKQSFEVTLPPLSSVFFRDISPS